VHRELATPALVLRTRPYGESDRIVTFITEQHRKLTGIAKGARTPGVASPALGPSS
jgi:recombinational DNA repair protein (RecF pathway)